MKYQQAKALAWAASSDQMTPTDGARFAGARYNTRGAYSAALALVCIEHGVESGPGQPTGDRTDYIRQPQCWFFEDRTVRCVLSHDALITLPEVA